ncbi:TadE/TadG family type IV pilus assembly protein [Vibrio tapetis]|uniref:Membrane associated secretion system protein n=1 Tax=Vibrio tapetis subsp. tapetis TaxID=1671868 RepID=A0A2N8ZC97_9VIBR|nr:TadE/TadG family type IV pilus assembly protein [Vibrio tapetis]SON49503.1 Membrane associated secretion system protein [Vibrio tapetis subsp. tapetis]
MGIAKRNKGHAAILFVLIIPALFGLFALGSDGARALQASARLDDGLEAASLAVAAFNDDNDDDGSGSGSEINQTIANAYINQYMDSMNSVTNVKIEKKSCEDIPDCVSGLEDGDSRFFEYSVTATTNHDFWFPNAFTENVETFNVSGTSSSRKYQNHAVDVVFVSDFSGSMGNSWDGGSKDKYEDLIDVIGLVTTELAKFNALENIDDNSVSFVAFNHMVRLDDGDGSGTNCYVQQLKYSGSSVSTTQTINAIFTEKSGCAYNSHAGGSFYDLVPTTNFTNFNNAISNFYPGGWTASYQGIIRGAQLLNKGANPRRLMIVLSDGQEYSSSNNTISNNLVNAGMCNTIRAHFDSLVIGEEQVSSKIAVIGFDYDLENNVALKNCAGSDNVYKAEDKNEILNRILELISEEIGHLK